MTRLRLGLAATIMTTMQVVALNLILDTMILTEASIAILGNKEV